MAHILPHWKWPERVGQVTPVHVYTSGDEAELFLNGRSLGRKEMGEGEYRLRWDDVVYEPGELLVIAYRDGMEWARDAVTTTGAAAALRIESDVAGIRADGRDLAFITLRVVDKDGRTVPDARNRVHFSVDGPGVLVATDNGDPKDFTAFPSPQRDAFNGLCLAIVRGVSGKGGMIVVTATGEGLVGARVELEAKVTDVCGAYKPGCHSSGTQR
jgi:beta-galactosidase